MRSEPSEGTELRRGEGDRGAAMAEFALVFPLLVFLVFGIFGAGMVLNRRLSITQAAREGARFGATVPSAQCTPTTNCAGLTWAQLVRAVTAERSAGTVTTANICVALVSGPGTAPVVADTSFTTAGGTSPCYVDNSSDTGKRVQVSISLPDKIDAAVATFPVTLNAQALSRFEG
jgi:Flp pilus assembly protein TadG